MARTEKFGVLIEGKETVSAAAKKSETGLKKLGSALSAIKLQIIAFVAAMYTLVRVMTSSTRAFTSQEQSMARLTQALKNQNTFSEKNLRLLTDQADALQKLTVFSDDQIISAQAMLASFALSTKQLKEMTPRLLDVATMTAKTTGEMMDLEGAAKFVGMALGGQAGRLTQAGIRLTDYQKASFRAANETERFNMLIEIFDQNAAGLALSVGETATGAIVKLKNAFEDLNEEVGKAILKGFEGDVKLLTKVMQDLRGEGESEVFWRKEVVEVGKVQLENYQKLLDLLAKIGIGTKENVDQTKQFTDAQKDLAQALLERFQNYQVLIDTTDEAYFKEANMNKIIQDAIKIGKGKTEVDRLQIQTVLDLTEELKNYEAQIKKDNVVTDEEIKQLMEKVRLLVEAKEAMEELTLAQKRHQELGGIFRSVDGDISYGIGGGISGAPRAVQDPETGKWGAPSSDEV